MEQPPFLCMALYRPMPKHYDKEKRNTPLGEERKAGLSKYICGVCGYVYDERDGDQSQGIAPGTKWEDVPEDWVCPACGADKSAFEKEEGGQAPAPRAAGHAGEEAGDAGLSRKQQAILMSNLSKAASKQHNAPMANLFDSLAVYFEAGSQAEGDLENAWNGVKQDIEEGYPAAFDTCRQAGDRGALRALTWGEKVSKIQANLLGRSMKDGDAYLMDRQVFVCEACGFVYAGEEAPEMCPVCKVPRFKFIQIQRGA